MAEERMLNDEILLGLIKANSGGGGGGTTDYEDLDNKPQIAGVTLSGDKSLADLGIASATTVSGILDGASIDSFADVETALAGKQGTLTAGDYINLNNGNISVNRNLVGNNYDYEIKSAGDYKLTIIKSQGGTVISTNTYDYSYGTSTNIDNNFTIAGAYSGGNTWVYTALKDSTTHSVGYTWTKSVDASFEETESFPSEDLSGYKLVIKSEMDTALSGKQDTLTFDDVPTENSNNPVKSNGIYDALELKQNVTDNSLDTEDKTIVGAINEHEGDIGTLKSGLTTLDNEVNGDAVEYPYADVITISDAIPANLADCKVKIEPVQDLHGQNAPYVGGASKNKLPMTVDGIKALNSGLTWNGNTAIKGGVPFTILTDSDNNVLGIKALGTSTAQIWYFNVAHITTTETMLFNTGNTYSWDGNKIVCEVTDGTNTYHASTLNGVEVPAGTYDVVIAAQNNATVDVTFLPMFRATTETDATFVPYTNICPITGHTEVVITDAPLVDWEHPTVNGSTLLTYVNNVLTVFGNSNYKSVTYTLPIAKKGLQHMTLDASTLHTTSGSVGQVGIIDGETVIYESAAFTSDTHLDFTFTTNSDYVKLKMYGTKGGTVYPDSGVAYSNITLNGDLISEPIHRYTIALGDTIYGGTVNFDSGVMTVTKATTTVTSLNMNNATSFYKYISPEPKSSLFTVNEIICEQTGTGDVSNVNTVFINSGGAFRLNTAQSFNTAEAVLAYFGGGLTVCYDIKDPFTIQLTPQQIQLLKGTNTLTASTGQISVTVNGVSGSIGAVQEQVNGIAEDVADVQSGLANLIKFGSTTATTGDTAYEDLYYVDVNFTNSQEQMLLMSSIIDVEIQVNQNKPTYGQWISTTTYRVYSVAAEKEITLYYRYV